MLRHDVWTAVGRDAPRCTETAGEDIGIGGLIPAK
jgi:hypothetical protein